MRDATSFIDADRINTEPFDPSEPYVPVLKDEPIRFEPGDDHLDHFIAGVAMRGASDLTMQTDSRPRIQINGQQHIAMRRKIAATEMQMILAHVWNAADASSILRQGRALDFSFEIKIARGKRQRYRVNATGIMRGTTDGIEVTMRALPETTPTLDDVAFEDELRPFLRPKSGMVVIGGATGQGKSTTMAAITRHHLETENPKIVDLAAPIEFDYADLVSEHTMRSGFIGQSEIGPGRNLPTFAAGVWTALRRAPAIINVGESRDVETMQAAIEACLTGHLVNTTTHAGSVAEALRRMASVFPAEEREGRAFDLITSLQVCIVQHLIRTSDGRGRIAVREYLVFNDEVRDLFTSRRVDDWPGLVAEIMATPGRHVARPLRTHASALLGAGRIKEIEAARFLTRRAGSSS